MQASRRRKTRVSFSFRLDGISLYYRCKKTFLASRRACIRQGNYITDKTSMLHKACYKDKYHRTRWWSSMSWRKVYPQGSLLWKHGKYGKIVCPLWSISDLRLSMDFRMKGDFLRDLEEMVTNPCCRNFQKHWKSLEDRPVQSQSSKR